MTSAVQSERPRCARFVLSIAGRLVSAAASTAAVCALMLISTPLRAQPSRTAGIVYVETNAPNNQNAVLAYRRDTNGRLHLAGVYPTSGSGVFDTSLKLGPFDSDQDLSMNAERTLLFAVNSGSNTIAVFNIQPDGALLHVAGSPFPSGGSNPVSTGLARDSLTVVNKAEDPNQPPGIPNYSAFRVTPDGAIAGLLSRLDVPPGFSPSQALVSAGSRVIFGADFLGGMLRSFAVQPDGSLLQADLQAPPLSESVGGATPLPLGLWSHPNQPVLYAGLVTVNKVAVYTYDAMGKLTFIRAVPISGSAVCWMRANADGTRLYTSNTGDNSISVFDTSDPLNPVEIQHLALKGAGSSFQLTLDPGGEWLYAVTQRASASVPVGQGNSLHVLRVQSETGRISEPGFSPADLPVGPGVRPNGVVAIQAR